MDDRVADHGEVLVSEEGVLFIEPPHFAAFKKQLLHRRMSAYLIAHKVAILLIAGETNLRRRSKEGVEFYISDDDSLFAGWSPAVDNFHYIILGPSNAVHSLLPFNFCHATLPK